MAVGFDTLRHEVVEHLDEIVEGQGLASTMGLSPDSN
jgi:hypothetical protein